MLYGNLRDFAEAIIKGDKYKAPSGNLRDLAEAMIKGDKYKAPSGPLRDFADAVIRRDKYKAADKAHGELIWSGVHLFFVICSPISSRFASGYSVNPDKRLYEALRA